ncbi:diguanylate cyclase [Ectothiorhodospiraceae bacterium 2226]|nr:diguanylate cyclase [Ectothiorhodospiraceae bacterium 2226]
MDEQRKGQGQPAAQDAPLSYQQALERLVEAVQALSLARDVSAIGRIVAAAARELIGAQGATVVLREGSACYFLEASAMPADWSAKRFALDSCISGRVIEQRTACAIEDVQADPRIAAESDVCRSVKSLAMVPVRSAEPLGAMAAYWRTQHHITPPEMRLLQALADATAVAMENIRVYRSLEERVRARTAELEASNRRLQHEVAERQRAEAAVRKLALTDSQTGLANRRGFFHDARQKLELAERHGLDCALLFVDVDGLKAVNDTHGHQAGDKLVGAAASVLQQTFRQSDVVGRIGGDEFAVLVVEGCDASAACSRVQQAVRRFNRHSELGFTLSLSIGVVPYSAGDALDLETLLDQADARMYRHKHAKRAARQCAPLAPAPAPLVKHL